MKKWHLKWLQYAALTALGSILPLAFAPYDIFIIAIAIPACLLAFWLNASPRLAFWQGFFFGVGFFGTGVSWVFNSIHLFGDIPTLGAALITGLFVFILALFPAGTGYILNRYFPNNSAKLLYAFPLIWVISEWARSWMFTGFPWLFLGYSQIHSPLKGFAPLLSVYGVSLVTALSSAIIVNMIIHYYQKNYRSSYLHALAFVLLWIAGSVLSLVSWTEASGKPLSTSLVQGNIPQTVKWSPHYLALSLERYTELTRPLWGKSQLIIWPESSIPLPLQNASSFINEIEEKAKQSHSELILGIPIEKQNGGYYNALIALGKVRSTYMKRRLVPFGEYLPFSLLSSRLFNFIQLPPPQLEPGLPSQEPIMLGRVNILTSICYEIAFPELIRSTNPDAGFLLTVTNDAWFGHSNAQAQHMQIAAMRALEMKRPLIFVSNDGMTGIIDASGKIQDTLPPYQSGVLTTSIQPVSGLTPWMMYGMNPLILILTGFLFMAVRTKKTPLISPIRIE